MRAFVFSLLLVASQSFATTLPIAQPSQFAAGNYWIWNYFENGDRSKFYSSEKYVVTDVTASIISIEIWTMYAGKTAFTPSAKFKVNLNDCTRSFAGGRHRFFTIEMYSFSNGKWSENSYSMKSTAFEEKFNCNPLEYPANHPLFATVYDVADTSWGSLPLFQQNSKVPSQITSFYSVHHPKLAAVAIKKAFNPESPYEFEFELSDFSTK